MRLVVPVIVIGCLVFVSACDRPSELDPNIQFNFAEDEKQFVEALEKSRIKYRIEVHDGLRIVSWNESDKEKVKKVKDALTVPTKRNLSLTPKEEHEEFKAWLKENSIPFETVISGGQEFVVWSEKDAERVKHWPKWKEPPVDRAIRP